MEKKQKNDLKREDFRKIIVAVDGSKWSKRAAMRAIDLARDTDSEIEAIYVVYEPNYINPGFNGIYPGAIELIKEIMKEKVNSILDRVKKMGSKLGVHVKTKLVFGLPDKEIIKQSGKNDLIIMGCRGHSGRRNILIGNVCERVMHHVRSHIMVIH